MTGNEGEKDCILSFAGMRAEQNEELQRNTEDFGIRALFYSFIYFCRNIRMAYPKQEHLC